MSTRIYLPAQCKSHDPVPGHPESPARIDAIDRALERVTISGTSACRESHFLAQSDTVLAHNERYVEYLFAHSPQSGTHALDADTIMDSHSLNAALLAAGTVEHAMLSVCNKEVNNSFCAVRPPGHHAEFARGMGFCFFNSVALAARLAIRNTGVERVAILDFDVHHGNGTQDIFKDDPQVLLCSSYEHPLYPYRNDPSVPLQLVNVPLPAGTGSAAFRDAINHHWWPALQAFAPDLILVSAGFDAHRADPLANLMLETDDYAWLGNRICALADTLCDGRVVATLEGGYNLEALAASTVAFVGAMAGH